MQGFVSGIGHHESKRLYEKCASRPDFMDDFMCLAKRFNAVFNLRMEYKRLVTELLLPKFIQNLFTYAEGSKVRVSLCILLKEN